MFGTPISGAHPAPSRSVLRLGRSRAAGEQAWRKVAACRGLDPAFFHPDEDAPDFDVLVEASKQVCEACGVRVACLEFAIAAREPDGVWGGLTAQERRREIRRRRRSA